MEKKCQRKIQRKINQRRSVFDELSGHVLTCFRGRRKYDIHVRSFLFQRCHNRRSGRHLANGNRVNPDPRLVFQSAQDGLLLSPEFLNKAVAVLACKNNLQQKIRSGNQSRNKQNNIIKNVHECIFRFFRTGVKHYPPFKA